MWASILVTKFWILCQPLLDTKNVVVLIVCVVILFDTKSQKQKFITQGQPPLEEKYRHGKGKMLYYWPLCNGPYINILVTLHSLNTPNYFKLWYTKWPINWSGYWKQIFTPFQFELETGFSTSFCYRVCMHVNFANWHPLIG